MGVLTQIDAIAGTVASGVRGLSSVVTALTGGSWEQSLRLASLGGVPFAVESATTSGGRQGVVHVYPFRDTVWVEDTGKLSRKFQIYGYLIENSAVYGGGGVVGQRERLFRAVEAKPGESTQAINGLTFVHPTMGTIRNVSCLGPIEFLERADSGRVLQFRVTLLQGGPRLFPSAAASTPEVTEEAANSLFDQALENFQQAMQFVQDVSSVVTQTIATARRWIGIARTLINDVRSIGAALSSLPGQFGRFTGSTKRPKRLGQTSSSPLTMEQLLAAHAEAREAALKAGDSLVAAASTGNAPVAFANAGRDQATALAATTADPAERIRILASLVDFYPDDPMPAGVLGQAMNQTQAACSAILRRCALVEIARATAVYEPRSSDDANAVRDQVTALLDAEIVIAGDTGDDLTYLALLKVRQAIVSDLNSRGRQLANLRDVSVHTELPALVLSTRLYRSSSYSDELIAQVGPIHPAFMPIQFQALDS